MFPRRIRTLALDTCTRIPFLHDAWLKRTSRDRIFGAAYGSFVWGSRESQSGRGSELGATENLRAYLPELLDRLDIGSMLDAPCGDWNWMRLVDLNGIDYVGADVVPHLIARNRERFSRRGVRFIVADLTSDELPRADLILCRDCLVHLSFRDIAAAIENFRRSGASWLLASNSPTVAKNRHAMTGLGWRHLNLHLEPFNFPTPAESRKDHYPSQPFQISLWRIADLPRLKP